MSVQFGKWNFDGKPIDPKDLDEVRPVLAPYGPDSEGYICKDNVAILYRAFHTTKESHRETQPCVSKSGPVLTWDGRLDNREELIGRLNGDRLSLESTDVEIVAAAYECWNTDAFPNLVGDWALSVWDPKGQSLILAKDFVGTRHLYYSVERDQVKWCTILDPLVLFAGHQFKLEEEYIAGWLAFFPAPHLTPYVGIQSVPPSSFVRISRGVQRISKYWDFDPEKRIRYRTDAEYEEHFRQVFAESVRRRLRSESPVLAELSGGMDSSSIVCMADQVLARGEASHPRLDTVSYFNDAEPNWNERPYCMTVEKQRGRQGWHIDISPEDLAAFDVMQGKIAVTPALGQRPTNAGKQLVDCVLAEGYRTVLSGFGGDEVAGGVPNPIPELADLIARAQFSMLARQLKVWALSMRRPWLHLALETARVFLPIWLTREPVALRPAPWISKQFARRNLHALRAYETRVHLFACLPSVQENLITLDGLRRQVTSLDHPTLPATDKRYPFLDRDLLEFLYSAPRQQLVRPGQRRSLMRRALRRTVPEQILNRRRKGFVMRSLVMAVTQHGSQRLASLPGIDRQWDLLDHSRLEDFVERLRSGAQLPVVPLLRLIALENWLGNLQHGGVLAPALGNTSGHSRLFQESL